MEQLLSIAINYLILIDLLSTNIYIAHILENSHHDFYLLLLIFQILIKLLLIDISITHMLDNFHHFLANIYNFYLLVLIF